MGVVGLREAAMNVSRCIVLESGSPLRSRDREATDGLWDRIALLARDDQVLVELSLKAGASHRQIGRLLKRSPGSVSRQLRRIGRRLHDPLVLALLHPSCPLDAEHRQIGVERFLRGVSMPELAARHQLPIARLRTTLLLIQGWHRGATSMATRAGRAGRRDYVVAD
jgi:hypothetical protein